MDSLTKLAKKTDSVTIISEHDEDFSAPMANTPTKVDTKIEEDLTVHKDVPLMVPIDENLPTDHKPDPAVVSEKKWYAPRIYANEKYHYNELVAMNELLKKKNIRTDELLKHEFQLLAHRVDKLEKTIKTDKKRLDMLNKPIMKRMVKECLKELLPKQLKNVLGKYSTLKVNNEELLSEIVKKEVLTAIGNSSKIDNLVQENEETEDNMATECVAKSYNEKSVSPEEKQPWAEEKAEEEEEEEAKAEEEEAKAEEEEEETNTKEDTKTDENAKTKEEAKADEVEKTVEKNTGAKKKDPIKLKKRRHYCGSSEEERMRKARSFFKNNYIQNLLNNPDLPNSNDPEDRRKYYELRQNAANLLVFKKSEYSLHLNDRLGLIQPSYNYHAKYNPNTSAEEQ